MAINIADLYPGQSTPATTDYPYGSARDVSSPGAGDGTPVKQAWVNDIFGFQQAALVAAGITPSGSPDTATVSQLLEALIAIGSANASGMVGAARNVRMNLTGAGATATLTADSIIVSEGLSGKQYRLTSFSQTVNISTTGANGMDTGSPPTAGYVALYAIYNPTTETSALLAVNATSAVAPECYSGSNMPSGYTASALVSVWRTASSLFIVGYQRDRHVSFVPVTIYSTTVAVTTFAAISLSAAIPPNGKTADVQLVTAQTTGNTAVELQLATSNAGVGQVAANSSAAGTSGTVTATAITAAVMEIMDQQALYYKMANTTSATYFFSARGYTF